jgi:probable HAF family extracellular repeat protein
MKPFVVRIHSYSLWKRFSPAAALVFALASAKTQAQTYSLTDLGTLGGASSQALGINGLGEIVGWSQTSSGVQHGFIWKAGKMTDVGTLGGPTSTATGINDNDLIVGYSDNTNASTHGFVYSAGTMTDLGTLGGSQCFAYGINNSNQITGWSDLVGDAQHHAFIYKGGTMVDLNPSWPTSFEGLAINASGQVVGLIYRTTDNQDNRDALLYSEGQLTNLGTLGGRNSSASGINNAGTVVGTSDNASNSADDAISSDGTTLTDLTIGSGFNLLNSNANGINNQNEIVGIMNVSGSLRAFVGTSGLMTDANTLLPANSGWTLQSATAINDDAQIVGYGLAPNGNVHGFLLAPVRDPIQELSSLISLIQSFNLAQGIENSLDAKLQNAEAALESAKSGALTSACGLLQAFINEVNAQSGNKINADQADQLRTSAQNIEATMGCP